MKKHITQLEIKRILLISGSVLLVACAAPTQSNEDIAPEPVDEVQLNEERLQNMYNVPVASEDEYPTTENKINQGKQFELIIQNIDNQLEE